MRYDPKKHNAQFEDAEIQRLRQELARMQNENARLAALFKRTTPPAGVPMTSAQMSGGQSSVPPFARAAVRTPKPSWAQRYGGRAISVLLLVVGFAAGLFYANQLSRGEAWRGFQDGLRSGWTAVGR